MENRGFSVNKDNMLGYFGSACVFGNPTYPEHNNRYLLQCFYNLQEKYDRGQKDFTDEIYKKLENFINGIDFNENM